MTNHPSGGHKSAPPIHRTDEMDYETCMVLVIRNVDMEEAVGYVGFPIPTVEQWKRCVQAVRNRDGDLRNPFEYLAAWIDLFPEWPEENAP